MSNQPEEKNKLLYLVRRVLTESLEKQSAIVAVYFVPCETHSVHNVYVSPPAGDTLLTDLTKLLGMFLRWTEKYDDSHTYVRSILVDGISTNIQYKFLGLKCAIHIYHTANPMGVDMSLAGMYVYDAGKFRCVAKHGMMPVEQGTYDAPVIFKDVAPQLEEAEETTPEMLTCEHPEHVATAIYMLVTLLGGKGTLRQMEGLSDKAKVAAFKYLRSFYKNKFFNGKEKTGRRPSFLQQFLAPRKT